MLQHSQPKWKWASWRLLLLSHNFCCCSGGYPAKHNISSCSSLENSHRHKNVRLFLNKEDIQQQHQQNNGENKTKKEKKSTASGNNNKLQNISQGIGACKTFAGIGLLNEQCEDEEFGKLIKLMIFVNAQMLCVAITNFG